MPDQARQRREYRETGRRLTWRERLFALWFLPLWFGFWPTVRHYLGRVIRCWHGDR